METNSLIIALVGFVQIIVIGLGTWMLITLVRLNATMAALNVTMKQLQGASADFYEYRRWSESKIKVLWTEHRDRRRRAGSVGDLERHGGGTGSDG